jgi:hypothetical protein
MLTFPRLPLGQVWFLIGTIIGSGTAQSAISKPAVPTVVTSIPTSPPIPTTVNVCDVCGLNTSGQSMEQIYADLSMIGVTFQADYRRLLQAIVCDPQDLDCADDVARQLVIADDFAANVVVELAKLEAVMCSDRLSVTPTTANSTTCPYPPVVSPAYTEGRRRHLTSSIVPDVLGGVLRVDQRGKYPRVRLTFLSFLFRLTATLLCFLFFLLLTITSSL